MDEQRFPPQSWLDIAAYDGDDVVAGYREHRISDPEPGGNRPPGYRWGWANARRDATLEPDGYDEVRSEYIQTVRAMN